MSPREVAERLGVKEFTLLCSTLDAQFADTVKGGPSMLRSDSPDGNAVIGDRRAEVRFQVLEVIRSEQSLLVDVRVNGSTVRVKLWESKAA